MNRPVYVQTSILYIDSQSAVLSHQAGNSQLLRLAFRFTGLSIDRHWDDALLVLHYGYGDRVDEVLGGFDEYGGAETYLKRSGADDPSLLKATVFQIRVFSVEQVSHLLEPSRVEVLSRVGWPIFDTSVMR